MSMDAKRLDEIRERCEAASPGPWRMHTNARSVLAGPNGDDARWIAEAWRTGDSRFTAHARTDVPDLLAEVERLRSELAERTAMVEKAAKYAHAAADALEVKTEVADRLFAVAVTRGWELERLRAEVAGLKRETAWLRGYVGGSLADCTGDADTCKAEHGECSSCSVRCCPLGDDMHFHHDSCPSEFFEEREAARALASTTASTNAGTPAGQQSPAAAPPSRVGPALSSGEWRSPTVRELAQRPCIGGAYPPNGCAAANPVPSHEDPDELCAGCWAREYIRRNPAEGGPAADTGIPPVAVEVKPDVFCSHCEGGPLRLPESFETRLCLACRSTPGPNTAVLP